MRPEDRLRAKVRIWLETYATEIVWSAIEHGRVHHGNDEQRAREWQRLAAQGVKKGIEDTQFVVPPSGRHLAIELKWLDNGQSVHQVIRMNNVRGAGGIYEVTNYVTGVAKILSGHGFKITQLAFYAAAAFDRELCIDPDNPPKLGKPKKPKLPADKIPF